MPGSMCFIACLQHVTAAGAALLLLGLCCREDAYNSQVWRVLAVTLCGRLTVFPCGCVRIAGGYWSSGTSRLYHYRLLLMS